MAYACQHRTLKPLENFYIIISDEGAYNISDEGAYRLGLVLLFRNGLYLPIYLQKLMFSLMKALTN